jgi:DNA ligase-associated metallophosphoesterase
MKVDVAGVTLELLPERAAYWPAHRTLFVADAHFGKAASFRAAGVFVPEATTSGALARLDSILRSTRAARIVFLGDFLHARDGRHPDTLRALEDWRARHGDIRMTLVRGNHDRHGDPTPELGIECHDPPLIESPFALAHIPADIEGHYVLSGHVHPCAVLVGPGRQREKLPCFWFGARRAVLPAFGEFTGVAECSPEPGDRIFVIAADSVVAAT